jgi:adenylate cyclase class 2
MSVEIEIKLKVDHLAPVRDRLRELGGRRVGEMMETNIFFDTPDRALLASDCGLRLRRSHDLETRKDELILTYKGPRDEGAEVKRREEIEVAVDHIEPTVKLLQNLGYLPMLTFEKRRERWKVDRCKVELDHLPHLGSFVEIECPSEPDVLRLRTKLGLAHVAPITATYADLVAHFLSDRGKDEDSLAFS